MDLEKKLLSLQEISKAQLSKILCLYSGTKCIVLEPQIIRPLERVCGVKWLKSNGVEKIFKLESTCPNFGNYSSIFYMLFSKFATFKQVVDQIRSQITQENSKKVKFHIIVVPRYLHQFELELEELGLLYSTVRLHSFQWLPLHLDTNILSLEFPYIYKKLFLQLDNSFLPPIAKALWHLFFVVGKPKFIVTLGEYAKKILHQIDILAEDKGDTDKLNSDFGGLLIIDRNIDYPSALLTPGTYSALLNEVYGVRVGVCEYKAEEDLEEGRLHPIVKKQPLSFTLDSNHDTVYADIKNRYFTEVTTVLCSLTKQLKTEKTQSKEMALDEIKRYVQTQLQATKSRKQFITNHLLAAETIINVLGSRYETQQEVESDILKNTSKSANFNYLEELICSEDDKLISLRLFCLLCVTQKLSESEVKGFWRKFLHQFGFQYSFTYRNLINANFISSEYTSNTIQSKIRLPKFVTREFYTNANKLKQIPQNPEKINLKFPTCASYVFGGYYIPLITQIASLLLNSTPIDEIYAKLAGFGTVTIKDDKAYPLKARTVLIYVIGGVTYAEIAACNLLESLTGGRIVIMSDKIISGNDLMKEMLS